MQTQFKTKECYYEWRSYWRRQYSGIASEIRYYKKEIKSGQFHEATYVLLRGAQMKARSLMMAREAAEEGYRMRLAYESAPECLIRFDEDGNVYGVEVVSVTSDEPEV